MRIEKFSAKVKGKIDAFVLPVFQDSIPEGTKNIIGERGLISTAKSHGFSGKKGEIFDIYDNDLGARIILVGLGNKKEEDLETLRRVYSSSLPLQGNRGWYSGGSSS